MDKSAGSIELKTSEGLKNRPDSKPGNQTSTKKSGRKSRVFLSICLAALAIILILAGTRIYHRIHYQRINLPIQLSNEEAVVKVVRDGLTAHNRAINISFTAKGYYRDQIETLTARLVDKALEPTDDPKQGDYIKFQYGGYQVTYSNPQNEKGSYDYSIRIVPSYYTTKAKEEEVDKAVQSYLDREGFTLLTSDYDRIKAAHDYIADHCEYDWRNSRLSHRHIKATAYGALINGEATCQGYSVALYRLLRESGVDCRVVTGDATSPVTGDTEYHAWNLVKLNGTWYNVDVSWDDETGTYDYFLKSDASFGDHVREAQYTTQEFQSAYPVSTADYLCP